MTAPARYVPGVAPVSTAVAAGAVVSTMYDSAIDPLPVLAASPCTLLTLTAAGVIHDDPPPPPLWAPPPPPP